MAAKPVLEPNVHRDKLGKKISLGDVVVFNESTYSNLGVGQVVKMTNKLVMIRKIPSVLSQARKYPHDVIVVDGTHVTAYLLKNSN